MSKSQVTIVKCDRCGREGQLDSGTAQHWYALVIHPLSQKSRATPPQIKDICEGCIKTLDAILAQNPKKK